MRASRFTAYLCLILFVSSSPLGTASAQDSLKRAEQLRAEAQAHFLDGQYEVGISKAREALAISEKVLPPNDVRLANPLFNLAQIVQAKARYTEARTLYERAVKIIELDRGPDHPDVGSTLDRLGALLLIIGDYVAAKAAVERAIAILEKTLHPQDPRLIPALNIMARIRMRMRDFQGAKAAVERAINIISLEQRKARQPPRRVSALLRQTAIQMMLLGSIHQRLGDDSAARNAYQQALKAREGASGPDHPTVAATLSRLANLSNAKGDSAAAKPLYERALAIARKSTVPEIQREAALGLAQIKEKENRLFEAVALYQETIRVLEGITGQFEEESARGQYLQAGNKLAAYDALAQLLLKLHEQDNTKGYDREAWAILDAKKNRVVAEVITASRPKLEDPEAKQEIEKASEIQEQTVAVEKALAVEQAKPAKEQESERVKSLTTLLAQTKSDYLKQVQTFLTRYPQYRIQFVDQQTVDPKALAKFADRLPAGTLAIQLFPSSDALYIFAVAPGGYFKVKSQALPQSELYKMIKEYRQYLERAATQRLPWNDDDSEAYRRDVIPLKELTRKLGGYLLGPIETELREHKNVVLIPNDMLLNLPIHALTHPQADGSVRFLSETHVISYLTQLELADLLNPVPPNANAALLALANPDGSLPGASQEVREIGKIRPSVTTLDGAQATKEQFLSLAGKFQDLHLATHGVLDPERPENSYLLMAGADKTSQQLTIGEIAGLRLAPNGLAILSACETAVGEQVPGAALITLSAAFSQAGSQSIMASLWKVEDSATRDLMIAFHSGLAKVGRAVALQQAQLQLILGKTNRDLSARRGIGGVGKLGEAHEAKAESKSPGSVSVSSFITGTTSHPYYWAPFILIGGR